MRISWTAGSLVTSTTAVAFANLDTDKDLDILATNNARANVLYLNDAVEITRLAVTDLALTVYN